MKLRNLCIPTILLTIIGGAAKICDTVFNVHGEGFLFDSEICNSVFVGSLLLILFIGWILSLADRKKQFNAVPLKDGVSGFFGFIASVTVLAGGVLSILRLGEANTNAFAVVSCIMALLGGGILLFEACISFTGQNGMQKVPVLSLTVPIYLCTRFITLFSQYTEKSILATEMFDIVSAALLLLFFLYQSMFFAGINNSAAVRKMTVYGAAYIMCGLIVSVDLLIKMTYPVIVSNVDTEIVEPTVPNILLCVGDIALCGYAAFFIKDALKSAAQTMKEPDEDDDEEIPALLTDSSDEAPIIKSEKDTEPAESETAEQVDIGTDTSSTFEPEEEKQPEETEPPKEEPNVPLNVKPVVAMPIDDYEIEDDENE